MKKQAILIAVLLAGCGGDLKKEGSGDGDDNNVVGPNNEANNVDRNNVVDPNNEANNVVDPANNVVDPNNVTPANNVTPSNNVTPTNNVTPPNNETNNVVPGTDIHVQLTWDTRDTDLDLHFAHPEAGKRR